MYADAQLSAAMESMVRGLETPVVPMAAIRDRMTAPPAPIARRRIPLARYAIAAAAAIALFFAIFPKTSLALFERIVVNSYAAADRMVYHLTGWSPPPPPPRSLEATQKSERLSLAAAQAKVDFTIVLPAGVPSDAILTRIDTMPVLAYDETKHRWSQGAPALEFVYSRSGGRTFSLQAEKDDPRTGAVGTHIWRTDDLPGGKVSMTKFQRFVWKNGDQMMTAIADEGITPAEVLAIRAAMHGQTIVHNAHETIVKQYRLP
jgi:hypothetical protein